MTITPTIGIEGAFRAAVTRTPSMTADPRLSLFPAGVAAQMAADAAARPNPRAAASVLRYARTAAKIAGAGGTVVSGTDSPLVPYGLSLHVELETLVAGGLTPYQALQTATVNAARALGVGDALGTIEPGKLADLVFVGGDPLADIHNARDVRRVMRSGRLYTVRELLGR
jgi:imidazolonepropionase-like amidohydrolase